MTIAVVRLESKTKQNYFFNFSEEQVKEIKEEPKEVDDKSEEKAESSFDIPSHLPKKQRELFIRIQQQQLKEKEKAEREKAEANKEENIKGKPKVLINKIF